ncbi:MAG TPA: RNA-binding protein, partial [Methylomicrobium sp.]|nr:RNA-binding protein [Methylomicrobium sp.]
NYFIDKIIEQVAAVHPEQDFSELEMPLDRKELQSISLSFLQKTAQRYELNNYNYIKPGIGEATRVLLRREARLLMVKSADSEAVRHLLWLAQSKSIPIEERKDLPYCAAALIKEVKPTV